MSGNLRMHQPSVWVHVCERCVAVTLWPYVLMLHACRQVYTFAGPRVGDLTFVAYNGNCYQGKLFRIVHSADLVPKVRDPGTT